MIPNHRQVTLVTDWFDRNMKKSENKEERKVYIKTIYIEFFS